MTYAPITGRLGRTIETVSGGERVRAFVPAPLPPVPAIQLDGLLSKLGAADRAIG